KDRVHSGHVCLERGNFVYYWIRLRQSLMLNPHVHVQFGVVRRNRSARAQRGLNESRSSRACSTCATGCSASTRTGSACAEAANAASGSALHHAGVDTAKTSASFGAEKISVRDRQVVAGNRQVKVVFQRKVDSIFQRQIQFSFMD